MTFVAPFGPVFYPVFGGAEISVSPPFLPTLKLWVDFSDISYLYQDSGKTIPVASDGDPIGAAADKSGNGFDALQATSGARPTYKTNIQNSLSIGRFDGTNSYQLVSDAVALRFSTAATFFMVVNVGAEDVRDTFLCKGDTSGDPDYLWMSNYTASNQGMLALYDGAAWRAGSNGALGLNAFQIIELVWDQSASSLAFLVNGANAGIVSTATAWQTSAGSLRIGAQGSTLVNKISGDIGEILIYSSAVSLGDRLNIRNWLNAKWNLY